MGKRGVEMHHIGSVAVFQSPVAVLGYYPPIATCK